MWPESPHQTPSVKGRRACTADTDLRLFAGSLVWRRGAFWLRMPREAMNLKAGQAGSGSVPCRRSKPIQANGVSSAVRLGVAQFVANPTGR